MRGLLTLSIALAACSPAPNPGRDLHGALVPSPTPRPTFTLTTTEGTPFAFHEATRGRLTLLFFGYTNCPDVCPATMANLGAVARRLTPTERRQLDVVFVTTDPARDRPEVLGPWLRRFDPDAIGLTGSLDEVIAAQVAAGVAPAIRDSGGTAAEYTVSHAAQVIVVSPDDSVHVVYPFGTRQREWAEDLPRLWRRWGGSG